MVSVCFTIPAICGMSLWEWGVLCVMVTVGTTLLQYYNIIHNLCAGKGGWWEGRGMFYVYASSMWWPHFQLSNPHVIHIYHRVVAHWCSPMVNLLAFRIECRYRCSFRRLATEHTSGRSITCPKLVHEMYRWYFKDLAVQPQVEVSR